MTVDQIEDTEIRELADRIAAFADELPRRQRTQFAGLVAHALGFAEVEAYGLGTSPTFGPIGSPTVDQVLSPPLLYEGLCKSTPKLYMGLSATETVHLP